VEGALNRREIRRICSACNPQSFPDTSSNPGHRGAYLLRRAVDGAVELVVLTIWESMESVRKFAGYEPEKAVVEPEARAVLISFDDCVTHFEIIAARMKR
jgi:heme-degrading monooxygenase HmoA